MPHPFLSPHEWLKPLKPRNPHEKHRAATSLELLFDLIFCDCDCNRRATVTSHND